MFSLLNGADISAAEREMAGEAYDQGVRDGRAEADALACAVADAWIALGRSGWAAVLRGVVRTEKATALGSALNALESATRRSPLRKVKP